MNGATTSPKTGSPRNAPLHARATPRTVASAEEAKAIAEAAARGEAWAKAEAEARAKWKRQDDHVTWRVEVPAWLLSFVVHLVVFVLLGLIAVGVASPAAPLSLLGGRSDDASVEAPAVEAAINLGSTVSESLDVGLDDVGLETVDAPPLGDDPNEKVAHPEAIGLPGLPNNVLAEASAMQSAGGLEGRLGDARASIVFEEGGTPESETAVRRALEWLKIHQRADGGWRFNLKGSAAAACQCRSAGTASSTTAATGLALMAFLGAGQTHQEGEYREVVNRGIYYLLDRLQPTPRGADLQEGTMYGQGIATIALCECYAMSNDQALRPWAQAAVEFILAAQDEKGGGWRYVPNEPGDCSMHGWHYMALRSGELGYLNVPTRSFALASKFLDSVESRRPFGYGYSTPDDGSNATLAIGALCRMYQGWPRNDSRLYQLVGRIAEIGPSADDMYYNYYATQVVHHWGGAEWRVWNELMREHLIRTQSREGCEAGSWQFDGNQGKVGGRLYNTAMAAMTLEVYYRHLPLYRPTSFRR